jgi:hypothetical protein
MNMSESAEPVAFQTIERDYPWNVSETVDVTSSYTAQMTRNGSKILYAGNTNGVVGAIDVVALYQTEPSTDNPYSPMYSSVFSAKDLLALQPGLDYGPGYYAAYWTFDYRSNKYKRMVLAGPTPRL